MVRQPFEGGNYLSWGAYSRKYSVPNTHFGNISVSFVLSNRQHFHCNNRMQ